MEEYFSLNGLTLLLTIIAHCEVKPFITLQIKNNNISTDIDKALGDTIGVIQNPLIEEGQTTQWPNEKRAK
jgi:hypothetical protein